MLLSFDPFQGFERLARELPPRPTGAAWGWMPVDAVRRGDTVELAFDLPGIDPASVELTVERNVLTIKAERAAALTEGDQYLLRERPQGTFTRQLVLSDQVDLDKVEAHYDQGVLTVTVPVAEGAKPHRIEIKGGASKAITGTSKAA